MSAAAAYCVVSHCCHEPLPMWLSVLVMVVMPVIAVGAIGIIWAVIKDEFL